MTLSIIQIVIILVVTGALKSYGYSWAMTLWAAWCKKRVFHNLYVYQAFVASEFGSSSAVSVVIFNLRDGVYGALQIPWQKNRGCNR